MVLEQYLLHDRENQDQIQGFIHYVQYIAGQPLYVLMLLNIIALYYHANIN